MIDLPDEALTDEDLKAEIESLLGHGLKQNAFARAAKINPEQLNRYLRSADAFKKIRPETRLRLLKGVRKSKNAHHGWFGAEPLATGEDDIYVDDLIELKLAADFARSALSSPAELVVGKQIFVERADIVTENSEFNLVKSIGGLRGYDDLRRELPVLTRTKAVLPWLADQFREDIQTLHRYTKASGPLRASCNIQLGPLATMYALQKYYEIEIDVEVKHASGVEMVQDVAKQINLRPFDFIACTTGAFNLTLVGRLRLTKYHPVVVICYENHEYLYHAKRQGNLIPRLRLVLTYGYSAGDEDAYVTLRRNEFRAIEIQREDQFSTLVRLFSKLGDGMAVNLWDPLTIVLHRRFGWARAALPPYRSQIVLYQHERFSQSSLSPVSEAFRRLYVQQWNSLRSRDLAEVLGLFWGNKDLKYQFWRGAGLDVLGSADL